MQKHKTITLRKHGNFLVVDPTDDVIFQLLKPALSFEERKKHEGLNAKYRKQQGQSVWETIEHTLFELDHKERIATMYGFWKLLRDTLSKAGYDVKFKDHTKVNKSKFTPVWNNIQQYELREGQPEFIQKVLNNRCGRIDCPTGFGKSFMLGIIASLFPTARIDIVTTKLAVLKERIYPELVQMVGDVGLVCTGKNIRNKRVMCWSARSLHKAEADADFLFGDECHELASDSSASQLVRWQKSRNFGLSASHDMRFDNKDHRMHGVFGPIIYRVSYSQSEGAGIIVPIQVKWSSVNLDVNPVAAAKSYTSSTVETKRHGFWRNDERNAVIANDANKYDDDTQVLIVVETIEHAMNLKKHLPNFTLVYRENGISERDKQKYVKQGCISSSEKIVDLELRQKHTKDFETGKLKKAIVTTIWNVGVSFNKLQVLMRADGSSSSINDIQIPGRVSRISEGKECGIVHDYLDQFDAGLARRAKKRASNYKKMGWSQEFPESGSALENQLGYGDG